ncbi:hypothetical protein PVK06_049202 [Gossypium arboreum]|uniref:RNase H type-1 domain-containing protein n=1 Tax=Gossypium arboreum TaxID=29729 RepID=A0ABR0MI40_GOSAR|nr:hypothetical protein PVK06_049202 [Gossypium arboreum]
MIHLVISAGMIRRMFYIFFVTALLLRMFGLRLTQALQFFSTSQVDASFGTETTSEAHLSEERVYLNNDGAVHLDSGFAATGGVVRDKSGNWIIGFHRFLGKCSIFDAELWGILDGLKLVQRKAYDQVIIFSDCLEVVKAINGCSITNSNSAIIRHIHNILSHESPWSLHYIPREHNHGADYLAKQALLGKENLQVFDVPPEGIHSLLDRDRTMSVILTY